jgi:hypothetical protein
VLKPRARVCGSQSKLAVSQINRRIKKGSRHHLCSEKCFRSFDGLAL